MNKNNDMTNRIMQDIKSGRVSMRPHWWFVGAAVSAVVGLVASIAAGAYLVSMFVLEVRIALASRPAYGMRRNLAEMAGSFPWRYMLLALAGLGVALWIARKFDFSYKFRLRYVITALCLFVLLLGIAGGLLLHPGGQRHQYGKSANSFYPTRYRD